MSIILFKCAIVQKVKKHAYVFLFQDLCFNNYVSDSVPCENLCRVLRFSGAGFNFWATAAFSERQTLAKMVFLGPFSALI